MEAQLDALLAANIQGYDSDRVWDVTRDGPEYGDSPEVDFCSYSIPGVYSMPGVPLNNYRVTVYVAYKNPVFFPLLSYATDLLDRNRRTGHGTSRPKPRCGSRLTLLPSGLIAVSAMSRSLGAG